MKFARALLIFCYGLFTIAAQTLLFREFITAMEGNDISVGLFFASWLLWIGAGAMLVYRSSKITDRLLEHIDLLFLAYIPAFVLELILIIQARQIAGVSSYTLLSTGQMVFLSLVVNIPVSLLTGMLFPLACRWIERDSLFPVSNVYILEAAGSFLGGIAATVLLSFGVHSITIFFLLVFIISFAAFIVRIKFVFPLLITACALLCLVGGIDKRLNLYIQTVKWSKLLPAKAMSGAFQTPQAEYLYGTYRGQWVVISQGSVCEMLPDKAASGRVAAIALSQKPDAKNILVVGSGLGLCYEFLLLPHVEKVTWTHSDSQYTQKVDSFLPAQFKINDARLSHPGGDIRSRLSELKNLDIVIINFPPATSSVLNRYFTVDFFKQLKKSMSADGIIAVRVTGGENIMGTELIDLGASTKHTLEKVFSRLVLTPGDDTWFIASDSDRLTGEPGILQERFAKIKNADAVFAPSALLSVYLPDRAADAIKGYNSADLPQDLLINTDSRPLTSLYSLLLALKQSGAPVTKIVKLTAAAGISVFLVPVFVLVVLRTFYIARTKDENRISSFDGSFLVFSAGWLGIGTAVVLMYLYQTIFGSLYLHIGVISSLFMIGLASGAALIRYLPGRLQQRLFIVIFIHAILLFAVAYLPVDLWTRQNFAVVFFLCGLCSGAYFPIAAGWLLEAGFKTGPAGAKLETADHIGASIGSFLTSLALVPVLGTKGTMLVFLSLVATNVPPALFKAIKTKKNILTSPALEFRSVGYVLFGIAASVIICSNLLTFQAMHFRPSLPHSIVQTLAGQLRIKSAQSGSYNYFKVYNADKKLVGFIFSSEDLAPEVSGFGGKINLAVYIDTTGKLIDFKIVRCNETPSYLAMLTDWFGKLKGRKLFEPHPPADTDYVTGATTSSQAIAAALQQAGKKFADVVLGKSEISNLKSQISNWPDRRSLYLLTAIVLSLAVIYKGEFWSRLIVLVFNLAVGGFILNAQYSSEQIIALLTGQTPAFLLVVGVPLLILFFGNIYCGYLCPFGAAQELVSYIVPDKLKQAVPYKTMRQARLIKYIILFIALMAYFCSRSRQTLAGDPLISAFNFHAWHISLKSAVFVIIVFALIGTVFYRRFWCRYLCPVGAFLSLFNNLIIFKRFVPIKSFIKCEFGLTAKDNMDCIYCDRCRYQLKGSRPAPAAEHPAKYLLILALIMGVFVSAFYVNKFFKAIPLPAQYSSSFTTSAGQPRDVDLQRIRTMIEEKKLSDREADFYEKKP